MSINRNLASFASKVTSDGNSYISITVTVAGGKFVIDGTSQQIVSLAKGQTYRFDNSDSTNSGHPFVFSTDSSNSSAFTTGVTTSGTAGSSGAYVEVTLEQDAPDRLFYYCSNHSGMGAMVKTAPVGDANFGTFVDTFTFPTSDGTADQVLKTDGSGALGFADAGGGGGSGGTVTATASGALTDGQIVILKSDGTVAATAGSAVTGNVTAVDTTAGIKWSAQAYDVNSGKIVMAYQLDSSTTTIRAVVGTVSGSSISFGTSVQIQATYSEFIDIDYDANAQKVVIIYCDGGDSRKGKAVVGTVSGTSISFGSIAEFSSSSIYRGRISYDANAQKHLICYDNNSSTGECIVGTVSSTSISFGSSAQFDNGWAPDVCMAYDTNNQKHLVAWRDNSNSNKATAVVATISGTSVSYGSTFVISNDWVMNGDIVYDSGNGKLVICCDLYNSSTGTRSYGIVATISGTDVTFGTPAEFNNGEVDYGIAATYHAAAGKVIVNFEANEGYGSDYPHYAIGTVSGTDISFATKVKYHTQSNSGYMSAAYDSATNRVVLAGQMSGLYCIVISPSYSQLTSENFLGISDGAYADGATATIQVAGSTDDAQSSLTAGQQYYVQTDGTLGLTPDDPSVVAGIALSATKLLIQPDNVKANLRDFILPASDGTANQMIITDGNGQLSFTDQPSAGGGGISTFGAIQRNAITVASGSSNLTSTDFVTYSGSGNKRYKGFMTWENNSGTDNFKLYMSSSAATNIVSGSINGIFKNSSSLTDEAKERFYGTWDDTNNRFDFYLPLYSTGTFTWTQDDIFTHTYAGYPRYPQRYTYIEFDIVLSGSWQGGIDTSGGWGTPSNAAVTYTEVS